jgi:hypothetical protein
MWAKRLASRSKPVRRRKPMRRVWKQRQPDSQVQIIVRKGRRLRLITKTGGRKVYRPLRRTSFASWWKVRAQKRFKRRKSDKKRLMFRFIIRARNDLESRILRKRRLYVRHKRLTDYRRWKLSTSTTRLYFAHRIQGSKPWLSNRDLTTTFEQPRLAVRRVRSIALSSRKPVLDEKLSSIKQNRLLVGGSIPLDPWSKTGSVRSYVRPAKRMRKYLRSRARRSPIGGVAHETIGVRSLHKWRSGSIVPKHSASALVNPRFNAFWKHGFLHR